MRFTKLFALSVIVAALPIATSAVAQQPLAAAVANTGARSTDNVKLDESRKPAELLKFFGLKPGTQVIDMFGGNGYWTEIIAPAVGPKGKVYVWEPTQFFDDKAKAEFAKVTSKNPNVSITSSPFEAPQLPSNYADFMLINLDYHDVYWESAKYGVKRMEPADFLKAVYASLKPGGIVGVVDHTASPGGDTRAVVDKVHRIDPAVVKADFERAGFKLVGTSDMYRNAADDHSLLVFDPKVRGKTDRFVMKFQKPR
ncbi:MAG TPA: methyltransferase [Sphingomicrobium sp.]|nr:methyltransferase [Sphingomicrobium sp.]